MVSPTAPIYQGLFGDHPEPRFRGEGEPLWSGPLPSVHQAGYRGSLAQMYMDDMRHFLSEDPVLEDIQAVVQVCWDNMDGPLEQLRVGETTLLEGRHLQAARDVLSIMGPRIYVAIHTAMLDVYGKAHPTPTSEKP